MYKYNIGTVMANEKITKKRKKKRRKFRKLFVSTAAFITAAVVVIFCVYYVYFETDYFNVAEICVSGNSSYESDYIVDKSRIKKGQKIFSVERSEIREIISRETYVKSVRVIYELPDKILIKISERQEKYQVHFNNEYIVIDDEGIVLRNGPEKNELITIESLTDVLYNIGETIQFSGVYDASEILRAADYINEEFGTDAVKGLSVDSDDSFLLKTEYGTCVKIKLNEDIKYQVVFAMKIINERLNNNLVVSNGLIDFTKGDSPVYIEDFKAEENNE